MTRRDLDRRISRLEALTARRKAREPLVLLVEPAEAKPEPAGGQRVVIDWFRDAGSVVWARARITSDPAESGQRCAPGGYLAEVLAEVHRRCYWSKISGACRMCQGTPFACSGPGSCSEEQKGQP